MRANWSVTILQKPRGCENTLRKAFLGRTASAAGRFLARFSLIASAALLSSCIESYSPTIAEGSQNDLGPKFELTVWMPPVSSEAGLNEKPRNNGGLAPYPGLDALSLNFRRVDALQYLLSFSHIDDGRVVEEFPSDDLTKVKVLESFDGYKVLLTDVLSKIGGNVVGGGAAYVSSIWLVDRNGAAFPGSLPCNDTMKNQMTAVLNLPALPECEKLTQIPPLSEWWQYALTGAGVIDMKKGLFGLYEKAVRERNVIFLIDCSRYAALTPTFHDFPTRCLSW